MYIPSNSCWDVMLNLNVVNYQDFGDSIPGHGGITDRMDCQVSFTTYYHRDHSMYLDTIKVISFKLIYVLTDGDGRLFVHILPVIYCHIKKTNPF